MPVAVFQQHSREDVLVAERGTRGDALLCEEALLVELQVEAV